jgi:hypothetical protein
MVGLSLEDMTKVIPSKVVLLCISSLSLPRGAPIRVCTPFYEAEWPWLSLNDRILIHTQRARPPRSCASKRHSVQCLKNRQQGLANGWKAPLCCDPHTINRDIHRSWGEMARGSSYSFPRGTRCKAPAFIAATTLLPISNPSSATADRVTVATNGNPQSSVTLAPKPHPRPERIRRHRGRDLPD